MFRGRGHHILLVGGFLISIGIVGIVQATIEISGGEPPQVLDVFRQAPTPRNLRGFEKDLEARSWFAARTRPLMQYGRYVVLGDAGEKALLGHNGWWFYRPDVNYLVEPCPASAQCDAVSTIVSFRDQLAARNIHLLVIPMPVKASVYPEKLTARAFQAKSMIHAHTRVVLDALCASGVETLDLVDAFVGASSDSRGGTSGDAFLVRDTHWSASGVRLAAVAVARRVQELEWAPARSRSYDLKEVRVERLGDIPRMLRSPWIERMLEPERVRCEQVVRSDTGAIYHDDPDARILVLGDSFLRIYESDEPGSAGFIAHLARELRQPLSSIVNDGGGSTLVRQQLARKTSLLVNKTLVIWEFVERDIRFGTEGWQQVTLGAHE